MNRRDYALARRHFSRVDTLDLTDENPFPVAQALVGLGNCAWGEGQTALASRLFSDALRVARRHRLRVIEATSLTSMGRLDLDTGRVQEGARRLTDAIDLFMAEGEHIEACRSLTLLSHTRYSQGRYDEATAAARRAIDLATALETDQLLAGAMTTLANCWLDLGLYDEATALYRDSIDISQELGDTHRAAIGWYNVSLCAIERVAWDEAEAALDQMLDPDRQVTARLTAFAECNAGMIAEGRLRFDDARLHYQRSLDLRTATGQEALAIDSLAGLLRVATVTGDPDATATLLEEIQTRIETRGIDGVEHPGRLFLALANASMALDDPAAATRHAAAGVEFISARARRLADPAHRASYLQRVPSHRRLAELAASLGVETALPRTPVSGTHRHGVERTDPVAVPTHDRVRATRHRW
jgi:tetratricopeptide (TPR) repeat protein